MSLSASVPLPIVMGIFVLLNLYCVKFTDQLLFQTKFTIKGTKIQETSGQSKTPNTTRTIIIQDSSLWKRPLMTELKLQEGGEGGKWSGRRWGKGYYNHVIWVMVLCPLTCRLKSENNTNKSGGIKRKYISDHQGWIQKLPRTKKKYCSEIAILQLTLTGKLCQTVIPPAHDAIITSSLRQHVVLT